MMIEIAIYSYIVWIIIVIANQLIKLASLSLQIEKGCLKNL